jgi:hypothetical protein
MGCLICYNYYYCILIEQDYSDWPRFKLTCDEYGIQIVKSDNKSTNRSVIVKCNRNNIYILKRYCIKIIKVKTPIV